MHTRLPMELDAALKALSAAHTRICCRTAPTQSHAERFVYCLDSYLFSAFLPRASIVSRQATDLDQSLFRLFASNLSRTSQAEQRIPLQQPQAHSFRQAFSNLQSEHLHNKQMSSWVKECSLRVPSYHATGGKIFFAIELTRRHTRASTSSSASSMRQSIQSNASSQVDHRVTYRSYSQFRELWKTLSDHQQAIPASQQQRQRRNTIDRVRSRLAMTGMRGAANGCRCDGNTQCRFDGLRHVARVFPFPSRCPHFVTQSKAMLSTRRKALETFVREVQAYFATFSDDELRAATLANSECAVLHTFAAFLQADVHFPTITTPSGAKIPHQPLGLQGWRQQCADQMMMSDDDAQVPADSSSASSRFSQRTTLLTEAIEKERPSMRASLPVLQVQTVKVETMYTFLEEFCDHVLAQYAHDIGELSSPSLTTARRWEICLYVACRIGHTYAVQLLLFNYADANTCMADGSSCLHIAARMGHTDIVELLLEEGADVNQANDAGVTPLIAACRNGCVDVATKLLCAGASVAACSSRGTFPLHAAIVSQNVEIVHLLVVDHGADVNVRTASGITPLHFAAKLGSLEITEFLLQQNADVAQRTQNDSDAMMIAVANDHVAICALLQRFASLSRTSGRHISECGRSSNNSVSAKDDAVQQQCGATRAARCSSKGGEMVRMHSQRLPQCI
ncbi:Ankyrin repeat-containing protein, partial [Globisporangium splendens]